MAIELSNVSSGYSTGVINDNFEAIEAYINDNLLNRDGTSTGEVNQMELSLDMNSNFIFNLPEPTLEHQAARLQDVQNALSDNAANLITFTPYGNISSENVQGAIQELVDGTGQSVTTSTGDQTLVEALDQRVIYVDTKAAIKSLSISGLEDGQQSQISGDTGITDGGGGLAIWRSGDQSANVSADPNEETWIAPDDDATGTSGAWKLYFPRTVVGDPGSSYRSLAAVIRNDGTGWAYIDDATHTPIGFDKGVISASGDFGLDLGYSFSASRVGSLLATTDETLARKGIIAGFSVNRDNAVLNMTAPLSLSVDIGADSVSADSIWGTSDFSTSYNATTNTYTVTIPDSLIDLEIPTVQGSGSSGADFIDQISYSGGTGGFGAEVSFRPFAETSFKVAHDGTSWSFSEFGPLLSASDFSIDSASGGVVTINVPRPRQLAPQVTVEGSTSTGLDIFATASMISNTQLRVRVFDSSGALISDFTGLNISVDLGHTWYKKGGVSIRAGRALLRPENVVSVNGNIWVHGVHKA